MIRVDGLDVRFGSGRRAVHAVRGVSFAVDKGDSFGLVGESGSGKSTVLRAIAGLIEGWSGVIEVDGVALAGKRPRAFAKLLQMVFQDPYGALHPRHTVHDIVNEPLAIHGLARRAGSDDRLVEVLEDVGLGAAFRFRYPHQLSGGQRQRVAIARALILEPRILLLDEPTSALDVSVQAEILNLLNRLRREHGLTYVMVSHDLAVVGHMCERVAVMNNGLVVEQISDAQLRGEPLEHAYTRQLLLASRGYDRAVIDRFVEFD